MTVSKPVDYLFLLIGRNPLPNFVAAHHLLTKGKLAILLHSEDTIQLAKLLKKQLETLLEVSVEMRDMPAVDANVIKKRICDILDDLNIPADAPVGLNYTGGTKPMALHVYRTLSEKLGRRVSFSYLNGLDLRLYLDGHGNVAANDGSLCLSLADLAALHGYEPQIDRNARQTPQQIELAQAILRVHRKPAGQTAWLNWRRDGFSADELPALDVYPELTPIVRTLAQLCDGQPASNQLAQLLGYDKFNQCGKWLNGGWLEDIVLHAVGTLLERLQVKDDQYMSGLKLKPLPELKLTSYREFESDVLVVRGFQIFLISCIANSKARDAAETKKHLFEAYVRARQMGGDEARTAVVCLLEDPQASEDEINREWMPTGGIRVFGKSHLIDLRSNLRSWIEA